MKINKNIKLWKAYSTIALIANILTALSVSALAVLGVISYALSFGMVVSFAVLFGVLGLVGRFVKQDLEDDGKLFWEEDKLPEEEEK